MGDVLSPQTSAYVVISDITTNCVTQTLRILKIKTNTTNTTNYN